MKKTLIAAVLGAALALPSLGAARTDKELTYRENEIWQSAIRFIRVDSGFKILEKDKDAGYLLFEYKDGATRFPASSRPATASAQAASVATLPLCSAVSDIATNTRTVASARSNEVRNVPGVGSPSSPMPRSSAT